MEPIAFILAALILPYLAFVAIVVYVNERLKNPFWPTYRPVIAAGTLLTNCVRCGYDLHGLPPDSNCPECGTEKPQWTIKTARGPRQWSGTRPIVLVLLALSTPLMGLTTQWQWRALWAWSRWGPHPHFAVLSPDYDAFWAYWIFFHAILFVQVCPLKAQKKHIIALWLGGLFGLLATNALLINILWHSGRVFLVSSNPLEILDPSIVPPHLPIAGMGLGLALVSFGLARRTHQSSRSPPRNMKYAAPTRHSDAQR